MMTSTPWIEDYFENITSSNDVPTYRTNDEGSMGINAFISFCLKWLLRLACIAVIFVCPGANYKLIQLFQTRRFYKESSAKWYIIFKAVFDTLYMLVSVPIIFFLTFHIDIIHKNSLTCKSITYVHYLSDDLISIMLAFLCIDRMIRITCGYRLRTRCSLTVCIILLNFFLIVNIHHIIRLQHEDGFCRKVYLGVWDYDFDIYYSFIYTSMMWTIIFIALINLTVSVYCDRTRRMQLKKEQQKEENEQKISKISLNGGDTIGSYSDRMELIHSTDDWDDSTSVIIEQNNSKNTPGEQEQQDNIDLQLTVSVLISSAIFLACNLPNFIIFVMKFVYSSPFSTIGYVFVYLSLFPLFIAHTISFFVFKHLAEHIFPNNSP